MTEDTKGRQRERGKSPRNHGKSRKTKSKSRARVECWNYGKKGHLKKYCRTWRGKNGDGKQKNNQEANVAGDVMQDALILSVEYLINF